ncbi:PP2C family protein-serine/threonine phosphatase [Microbacterium sp. CH12i]|uniref:PP2C family protein-serine/threonine phosphatase n=1 Tax=Microbacterium sp. CH12i TaxID=1479651 RepID=UPI000AD01DAD|nr:protein phosphatase 2C domain-containing protein [Microbacterium sp. CH12i]
MTAPLVVSVGSSTHTGLRRTLNEDSLLASAPVFIVADGMGGHEAGERASTAVISAFSRYIGRESLVLDDVREALSRSREAVEDLPFSGTGRAGTTLSGLVLATVDGMGYWLTFNVGDSRTYRLADGELEQISVDHSVVQELIESGEITAATLSQIRAATSSRVQSVRAARAMRTSGCFLPSSVTGCSSALTGSHLKYPTS